MQKFQPKKGSVPFHFIFTLKIRDNFPNGTIFDTYHDPTRHFYVGLQDLMLPSGGSVTANLASPQGPFRYAELVHELLYIEDFLVGKISDSFLHNTKDEYEKIINTTVYHADTPVSRNKNFPLDKYPEYIRDAVDIVALTAAEIFLVQDEIKVIVKHKYEVINSLFYMNKNHIAKLDLDEEDKGFLNSFIDKWQSKGERDRTFYPLTNIPRKFEWFYQTRNQEIDQRIELIAEKILRSDRTIVCLVKPILAIRDGSDDEIDITMSNEYKNEYKKRN